MFLSSVFRGDMASIFQIIGLNEFIVCLVARMLNYNGINY